MIFVDTSALIAILAGEHAADACAGVLHGARVVLLSAASLTEAMIVAASRGLDVALAAYLEGLAPTVLPLTAERAERAAAAYRRFGKGFHSAGLNFGDCFAYATAEEFGCPLLFIGADFARTDLAPALPPH